MSGLRPKEPILARVSRVDCANSKVHGDRPICHVTLSGERWSSPWDVAELILMLAASGGLRIASGTTFWHQGPLDRNLAFEEPKRSPSR